MDINMEMKKLMKQSIIIFLKNIKTDDKKKINNVINFLERGWKYEQMWEEFKNEFNFHEISNMECNVGYAMNNKEQKYFPQLDKKTKV